MACSNHLFIVLVLVTLFVANGGRSSSITDPGITSSDYNSLQSESITEMSTLEPTTEGLSTEGSSTEERSTEESSTQELTTERSSTVHLVTGNVSTEQVQTSQPQDVTLKPLGPYQYQVVDEETGKVCIKAHIEAELIVHYISSKKTSLQQATIPVDTKSIIEGTCTPERANLKLDWASKMAKYCLQTKFNMINDSVKCTNSKNGMCWMLTSIQFTYDSTDSTYFYHAKDARIKTVQSSVNKEFFKTPDTMSQTCDKDVLLKLPAASDKNKDEVDIKFVKLHIQPFSLFNNTFGPSKECEEGNAGSQSVVSIAVGATLGVVILIVIIIYAVGRRIGAINDRTGYKSVD